ncbi:hypothetical protein COO60DRAFT_1572163 [Scenedesmus sp. NREL 46B-D3]|nr:hypothetical protein COO60DRAFT_1572163 [Scenedesmus sp. NREL 46B-D3]
MAATKLWASDTAEPWVAVQQAVGSAWQDNASERLRELNGWYEDVLPAAIAVRAPDRHMTAAELVQMVEWKLSYGQKRPRLLEYAKAAAEQQVQDASRKAFAQLMGSSTAAPQHATAGAAAEAAPAGADAAQKRKRQPEQPPAAGKRSKTAAASADGDAPGLQHQRGASAAAAAAAAAADEPSPASLQAALYSLTKLKGVGPATASAAMAAADASGSTPYMGDAALQAAFGRRDYTCKAYLQLVEALRAKADWLRQQDPGEHGCVQQCVFLVRGACRLCLHSTSKVAAKFAHTFEMVPGSTCIHPLSKFAPQAEPTGREWAL